MMRKIILVIMLYSIFLPNNLFCLAKQNQAQERRPKAQAVIPTLTTDQAIENALRNNMEFKANLQSIGVASGQLIQARKRPNPELELGFLTDQTFANENEGDFSASLSQIFETAGKRKYRILVAQSNLEKVRKEVENFERLLINDVKLAFYEVLLTGKNLELAQELLEISRTFVKTQEERAKGGDIPELELNLAKVELSRALRNKLQAENKLRTAKIKLNQLMGLPHYTDFKVAGDFSPPVSEYNVDRLVEYALAHRPDIKGLENEVKATEYDISLKKAEAKPNVTFDFGFNYSRDVRENRFAFGPLDISSLDRDIERFFQFQLNIPLPIFNRNRGNIESAVASKTAAAHRLEFAIEFVKREVSTAYSNLLIAQKAGELFETGILPQLKDNLNSIQAAYRLGAQSIIAVIQEQRTFFDVNAQYLQTLFEFQSALINLESVLGGKLSEVK